MPHFTEANVPELRFMGKQTFTLQQCMTAIGRLRLSLKCPKETITYRAEVCLCSNITSINSPLTFHFFPGSLFFLRPFLFCCSLPELLVRRLEIWQTNFRSTLIKVPWIYNIATVLYTARFLIKIVKRAIWNRCD